MADTEKIMAGAAEHMGRAAGDLADGRITVEQWRDAMRDSIRQVHLSASAMAYRTWDGVSESSAEVRIERELRYLEGFAGQIADGTQRVSWIDEVTGDQMVDGRFLFRCEMYARSGHGTYENVNRELMSESGKFTEERRVTHAFEGCDGCIAIEMMGWQPIGTLPEIGAEECLTACMCSFEYR